MLPTATTPTADPATSFTSLPPEIRTKIYKLSLRDLLVTFHSPSALTTCVRRPRYLGTLALLHTNRTIRLECAQDLIPIVRSQCQNFELHTRKLEDAISVDEASSSSPSRVRQRERKEADIKRAEMGEVALGNVKSVLWRVVLALPVVD